MSQSPTASAIGLPIAVNTPPSVPRLGHSLTEPDPRSSERRSTSSSSATSPVSSSLAGLSDGDLTYYLHVKDAASNVFTISDSIIVDTVDPAATTLTFAQSMAFIA